MVSVVVPLYYCDTSLFLPINGCLTALQEHYPDYELVVVDDCSPLEPYSRWPVTSRNEGNRGFTATVNEGLRQARGDVLVVLNDDVSVRKGQLDRFKGLEGLVIASPADTASSDDDRFGACWGMTRETYARLGALDESYRNFFSDTDYWLRAKEAGIPVVKWEDVVLEHRESSTFRLLDKEQLLSDDLKRYYGG